LIKKKRKFSARKVHTSAWENLDGVENPGVKNPVEKVEFNANLTRTAEESTEVEDAARTGGN
jgi:hypothetical protein